MRCFAPSEIIDPTTSLTLQAFGYLAESFIGQEYLRFLKRGTTRFFPAAKLDMEDITIEDWFENRELHVAFLRYHNELKFKPKGKPGKPDEPVDANKFRVPDLLTHEPEKSKDPTRAEYYEIKANSRSGKQKGRAKLRDLVESYAKLEVPYTKGSLWKPDEHIPMFDGPVLGVWLKAYFHYFHLENGLIVYDICLESDWFQAIEWVIILSVLVALILIIVKRGRVPHIPRPSPQPPPGPLPNPTSTASTSTRLSAFDSDGRRSMPLLANLFPQSRLPYSTKLLISDSVGAGGKNDRADVRAVQRLLNDWLGANRKDLLQVDGLAGPRTNAAILAFQSALMPVRDGRVDPTGFTIGGLVEHHLWSIFTAAKRIGFLGVYAPPKSAESSVPSAMIDQLLVQYLCGLRTA